MSPYGYLPNGVCVCFFFDFFFFVILVCFGNVDLLRPNIFDEITKKMHVNPREDIRKHVFIHTYVYTYVCKVSGYFISLENDVDTYYWDFCAGKCVIYVVAL